MKAFVASVSTACLGVAFFVIPQIVMALPEIDEVAKPAAKNFLVSIRSVGADNQIVKQVAVGPLVDSVTVDERISDLKDKLVNLKYRHFSLLSSMERVVPENQIEKIDLYGGHSVSLKPVRHGNGRIGLWLRWTDDHGVEVLNTKMHFDSRESMLAGMEKEGDRGMILAIGVRRDPAGRDEAE